MFQADQSFGGGRCFHLLNCSWLKQAQSEEKFFSKDVTHVVTARPIPAGSDTSPTEAETSSSRNLSSQPAPPRTINPSLLEKQAEPMTLGNNTKLSLENAISRKPKGSIRLFADAEPKKPNAGNNDVLQRAHGMGIKIWQLEKLNRVIESMNGGIADSQSQPNRSARNASNVAVGKTAHEADLSRMLRNEQLNGPSDRDRTVASEELVPFRGYYIYIHDMDERTKPILVKEYAKVNRSEDGDWPQFRANSSGKCPFVEDPYVARQEPERAKQQAKEERARARAENLAPSKTRAGTALLKKNSELDAEASQRRPLAESRNAGNKSTAAMQQLPPQEFYPPPPPPVNIKSPSKLFKAAPITGTTKFFGGEPAASGLQQSNITSAIRSQMISSTAAAPGAKAGTSREVHGLKRKVLERNAPALHGMHLTQRPSVPPGPARAEQAIPVTRQSRRRAQERLVHIEEESTQSEDEDVWQAEAQRVAVVASKPAKLKDPKPGYCENCRERYDDFDSVSLVQMTVLYSTDQYIAYRRPETPQVRTCQGSLERSGQLTIATGTTVEGAETRRVRDLRRV